MPVSLPRRAIIPQVGEGVSHLGVQVVPVRIQSQSALAGLDGLGECAPLALQPGEAAVNVWRIRLKRQGAPVGRSGGFPIPQEFLRLAQTVVGVRRGRIKFGQSLEAMAGRLHLALAKVGVR